MRVINPILRTFVTLLFPLFMIMTSVRILVNPIWLPLEYKTAGFPADSYGFSLEDRMYWSSISVEYLLNNQGIDFLHNQHLSDGGPLYNERELSHMQDVKNLVQEMVKGWNVLLILFILIGIINWRSSDLPTYWRSLSKGGWLTIGVVAAIFVGIIFGFDSLFTEFHHLFFSGDTWLFLYSDSLIRLFPIRFWFDAFVSMGVLTLAGGLAIGLVGKRLGR